MRTIVILTGSFPPMNIVGALRPYRLTKELLRQGWRVIILTNPPRPGWGLDDSLLKDLEGDYEIRYLGKPISQKGFWAQGFPARIIGTVRDMFRRFLKPDTEVGRVPRFCREFKKVAKEHSIDIVLTTSPPHSIHLAGLWIKKKYKLRWIVDYRDPWEYYPATGHLRLDNPLEKRWERKIALNADALISTTRTYTQNLIERHPDLPRDRFHTLTNTFDEMKTFLPVDKDPEKFVVCYTGIFYPDKDPYGFFRALRTWFDSMSSEDRKKYGDRLEVHLIGSKDRPTRETIENLDLGDNVIFFERMSHDEAIKKSLGADMLLISAGLGDKTRPGWLPSKLFEYLGCRIPIFALIREGEMADVIRKTNSGYVVTEEDHTLISAILKKEIDHKFNLLETKEGESSFSFNGIERFEEKMVMSSFASLINDQCCDPNACE